MGDMYIAARPSCPVHGPMHPGERAVVAGGHEVRTWVCHGWDGEGCNHTVGSDDLEWELIGQASQVTWTSLGTEPE